MQVANRMNWRERSITYLCRSFDILQHGQDYSEAKPVIHIGSLAVVYKLAKIIDKKALKILCFEHIECDYLTYSIR